MLTQVKQPGAVAAIAVTGVQLMKLNILHSMR